MWCPPHRQGRQPELAEPAGLSARAVQSLEEAGAGRPRRLKYGALSSFLTGDRRPARSVARPSPADAVSGEVVKDRCDGGAVVRCAGGQRAVPLGEWIGGR